MELGRFDGLVSTAASVTGNLPGPNDRLTQLNALFAKNKLTQEDMIALSGNNIEMGHLYLWLSLFRLFSILFIGFTTKTKDCNFDLV